MSGNVTAEKGRQRGTCLGGAVAHVEEESVLGGRGVVGHLKRLGEPPAERGRRRLREQSQHLRSTIHHFGQISQF